MHDRERNEKTAGERAILVSVLLPDRKLEDEPLNELEGLATTAPKAMVIKDTLIRVDTGGIKVDMVIKADMAEIKVDMVTKAEIKVVMVVTKDMPIKEDTVVILITIITDRRIIIHMVIKEIRAVIVIAVRLVVHAAVL